MINLKIRINVDEQTLTLPVDTQSVPGIPEKDPVVMVTEITEPEELKYLERDEWNIEELNFLAKRMGVSTSVNNRSLMPPFPSSVPKRLKH